MRKNPNHREIIENMVLSRKHIIIASLKYLNETDKQNNSSAHIKGSVNANANACQSAPEPMEINFCL